LVAATVPAAASMAAALTASRVARSAALVYRRKSNVKAKFESAP
jgi:hypothetical protein